MNAINDDDDDDDDDDNYHAKEKKANLCHHRHHCFAGRPESKQMSEYARARTNERGLTVCCYSPNSS